MKFDPLPDLVRPDRGILSALTAEAASAPTLSIAVRTDGLDAVAAEIAGLQAQLAELQGLAGAGTEPSSLDAIRAKAQALSSRLRRSGPKVDDASGLVA